jgi:hypothetical protein
MPQDDLKTDGMKEHVLLFKKISLAAHGVDHFILKAVIDLVTQVIDIDIDHIGEGIKINVPHMFRYHRAGDNVPGIAH